ncbi:hypothetical protein FRB99_007102 [Tulasnella sp. 403]|nr:hypothetical protein FRB99_007102 [Tulasnella sp. 403]
MARSRPNSSSWLRRFVAGDIKRAYRKKNPNDANAHERFQEMAEAYEVLIDPESREAYDLYGTDAAGGLDGMGLDPEDLFAQMFGMGFGGPKGPSARGPRRGGKRKGETSTIPYDVTLEDLYNGKSAHFNVEKGVICGACKGFGGRPNTKPKTCGKCDGKGITTIQRSAGRGQVAVSQVICPDCSGEGLRFKEKDRCKKCKGEKTVKEKKRLEIFVEKGMSDKQKIVLHGEGDQEPGAEAGDLVFVLKQTAHPNFERSGSDLHTTVHITLSEALLGFSRILITHLDGRGIHVDSEPGRIVRSGDTIVVRGEGMPVHKRGDEKGNLFISFEVDMPSGEWLKGLDVKSLEELLPPKKPDVTPRPAIVDEVAYEKADLADFGEDDEDSEHWTDDEEEGEGDTVPILYACDPTLVVTCTASRSTIRMLTALSLLAVLVCTAARAAPDRVATHLIHFGPQGVNLWNLNRRVSDHVQPPSLAQSVFDNSTPGPHPASTPLDRKYPARFFRQPLDHFNPNISHSFAQRYWVDDRFYRPGGPVFVLDGGETSGAHRLPFLDHGILARLSNATGGLSVVLEHRYYGEIVAQSNGIYKINRLSWGLPRCSVPGESIPVQNFTTDSLRWLTNEQALEDSARFMREFSHPSIDRNLSALATPWIYYGGSYAGARAAHMRVLYPDLVFGAIASSAVTHAAIDYSDYFEVIRQTNDETCVAHIQSAVEAIDKLLDIPLLSRPLKSLFGLQDLEHDDDFVAVLTEPLGTVQETNWDPAEGTDDWERFCEVISSGGAGTTIGLVRVPAEVVNYANWIRKEVVPRCSDGKTIEECFGTWDDTKFQDTSQTSSWRAWTFQVCTQWGYFMPAPADPEQPSLLSRRITLDYTAKICKQAFPRGRHFSIPNWPKVEDVNRLGDFGLKADRLAFVDGSHDPWLAATPHSWHAPQRKDSVVRPFKLIRTGVHHWDENGLVEVWKEPGFIKRIHREEVDFVIRWLREGGFEA